MVCVAATCGDGVQQAGEGCDDGNQNNDDDCPDGVGGTCQPATCGDGFVDGQGGSTEPCDGDGMGSGGETASCNANCTVSACGDGQLNMTAGEGCDDGDMLNDDDCPDGTGGTCQPATCGDGFVDGEGGMTEPCDGDGMGSGGETAACNANCTVSACGDGQLNMTAGEGCDDGDMLNNDDCPDGTGGTCQPATCGDGFVDGEGGMTEPCDGDGMGSGGETAACNANCTVSACGDGVQNTTAGEGCDDGDMLNNDDCPDGTGGTCQPATCGDGFVDGEGGMTEPCDGDGMGSGGETSTCNANCTVSACGDGQLNMTAGEACDDGNMQNNDDCPDGVMGTCEAASCSDGFLHNMGSGVETDVDCGGGTCPTCGLGEMCSVDGDCTSMVCDPNVCIDATVVSTTPADAASGVSVTTTIAVTFNTAMLPSSLTAKTTLDAGACSGSVQVSTDNFVTCVPMSSAAATMSGGDTIATFTPSPGLAFGSTFQIRVTTAAQAAGGQALAAQFTTATGFTTVTDTVALNETGNANEADFCNVQFPTSISMTTADTTTVFAQVFETGVTEAPGASASVTAEVGYGPKTANPQHETGWTWISATFNVQSGNNDEYQADFATLAAGTYSYGARFSLDAGTTWTYCDVNGAGSNIGLTFETPQLPEMVVTP